MMSDAKAEGYRRVEVLDGGRRRREWSEDDESMQNRGGLVSLW